MKLNTINKVRSTLKKFTLGLAAGAAFLTGSVQAGTWARNAWTNDATSGIGTASVPSSVQADYTVAVNTGNAGVAAGNGAVTVNGITFAAHAVSGTNFSIGGGTGNTGRATNVTGASANLASNFYFGGAPRTVTLTNLVVAETYETSFYAYGWDAQSPSPYVRNVTFASGSDSLLVDQNFYGQNNGIRISYTFVATATSRVLTLTPGPGGNGGTFHMSALANRLIPTPPATITSFGTNVAGSTAVISPVVANAATIAWTVPYGTVLANLAPTYTMYSLAATCPQPNDGVTPPSPNFGAGPVDYSVTDGAITNVYTVTATVGPPSTARDITAFNANFAGSNSVITTTDPNTGTVVVVLPYGAPAMIAGALAPTFTVSAGATANQVSGSRPTPPLSIGGSTTYTVTAQDGVSTKDYAVTVRVSGWRYSPWTGDADSGITGVAGDYTVAVNTGSVGGVPDGAVTVNGILFQADAISGTNFNIAGTIAATGRSTNVTGDSKTLADNFIYNASPRTVTLNNLTVGETYEASLFAYGWDASGRIQTFAAGSDTYIADQDAFGFNNGTRISYTFVASSASQVLTITQVPGGQGTFHLSALANRRVSPPVDSDNDGLADEWEMSKAGNLADLTGLLNGPGPGAGTGNFDGDTFTDAEEYALSGLYPNLNPKLADTDGDGLEDGAELFATAPRPGTNPTVADSDGDGLNDFVESNSGTFVDAGNPGTHPNLVDSDGDHYPDLYEINHGGNPTTSTSVPSVLPAGIILGVVTDEISTGISASETYTHKMSGGSAATINGITLDVLDTVTTPANFTWNGNAGGKSIVGPGIVNDSWVPANGNVTEAGNLQMFGTFTYSGGGAAPGSSQQFTLSALEAGLTYEMRIYIRKWSNLTVRPADLKFTNGAQVTNFYILEDHPGTVLGNGNDDSAYYISFTYVAQNSTLTLDATVPNVSSGNGSFHMYGMTNRLASEPPPLDFISIVRAANGSTMTLTWASRPGHTYAVDYSTNLVDWIELTDGEPSGGTQTVYVDTIASNLSRAQYRVRNVTPP